MSRPALTIGLLWHSMNSDNLGVGALTIAHMAILDEIGEKLGIDLTYHVLCWTDPRPPYTTAPNIKVAAFRTRDMANGGFFRRIRACDLILDIGAGDSFTDIYGMKRSLKMMASKFETLLSGRPMILSPQTIGPFEHPLIRRLALIIMHRARAVVTRDALSTRFLAEMGYRGTPIEATDVAFRLPYGAPPYPASDKIRVGINVSGLLMHGGYSRDNQFGLTVDYPALIDDIAEYFLSQPDVELHFVGHVQSEDQPVEDDQRACAALAAKQKGAVCAPVFASPSEAKSYISGLDYFMGARMHACIAAFSSGVPVLPMAYSRKFTGLFGTLGFEELADLKAHDNDEVLRRVRHGFENRAGVKVAMDAAYARGRAKLATYEAVLEAELSRIAAR